MLDRFINKCFHQVRELAREPQPAGGGGPVQEEPRRVPQQDGADGGREAEAAEEVRPAAGGLLQVHSHHLSRYDEDAVKAEEKRQEAEEKKRDQEIKEWDDHLAGRGYKNRSEDTRAGTTGVTIMFWPK